MPRPSPPGSHGRRERPIAAVLLLAGALACLCSSPAAAQPTVAHASADRKERARASYGDAKAHFAAGRFDEALAGFETSYEAVASPNSRLMIARCLEALGRNAEAYHVFRDTEREANQWGDARYSDAASAAHGEMEALKPRIAMLRITVTDPRKEATLHLGAREIPRRHWDEPLAADPGDVVVVLEAPDGRRAEQSLSLEAGVAAAVELALSLPPPRTEPEPEPLAPVHEEPAPLDTGDGSGMRTASYVVGGAGLVAIGAFAVLGAMSDAKYDDLLKDCPSRMACDPALSDTADSGAALQTGANVSLAVGAVAIGAAAVMFVLSLDDGETEVAAGPTHLTVRGRL